MIRFDDRLVSIDDSVDRYMYVRYILYYVIVIVLYVVLCCTLYCTSVLEDSCTVLEDSVLCLRTVHCTYCTLTMFDLINDTNDFEVLNKELSLN